ncbi:hypothetical protein A6A08_12915 [Nocardiopsis sp. TSRI0078]|uniref:TPR repeat region-containing protein n=1 Tax=unclassified Nocardiopsis TaxID=2649073 RepID=UPI00093BECB1|nr:hypothetical protein [Nocardiopsis sp. TSRI0078]OKI14474.1 hypothetical protein A6A08_12915 [Nocardiopsis sp. TSRI0078]
MADENYQISIKECDVSVFVLQNQQQRFDEMYSNICGRSASYNAVANTTATEFSELISEDIKSAVEENEEAWSSALAACIHAVGVISTYRAAVQNYNDRSEEIEENFRHDITRAESDSEKQAAVDKYQPQADEAWGTLEEKAAVVSDMLVDGPTPEHIRTLTEAGHLGNVPGGILYVVTGDENYFAVPPEMDGSEIGETIQLAAEGDEAALERLDESLALMNAFMAYLARKQENGGKLTERELEVLNDLNAHLNDEDASETSGRGTSSGSNLGAQEHEFFDSVEAIRESEHLSEEQREQLLAMIGGSLLAASDEDMGGEYENIPEIVRETIEGPRRHSPSSELSDGYSPGWAGDFESLTEMFESANQVTREETGHPIQGGTELSANLIGTIAGAVESTNTGGAEEETLRTMLEFATQNRDANYTILTGEYPDGESYQHPVEFVGPGSQSGTDEAALVAALLSHDWDHGGEAVRSLTDWLAEDGGSSDEEIKERADRAFEGLINIIIDPEAQEELSSTEYDVVGEGPDGEEFIWRNAPMGLLNPEISDSFAGIFETYIDEFADPTIMTGGQGVSVDVETSYNSGQGLVIGLGDRTAFTSLIAGDGAAMGRMYEAAQNYAQDSLYEYFTNPDVVEDKESARATGLLWNSVGFGIADAVHTRFDSHNDAIIQQNATMSDIVNVMAAGIPEPLVAEPVKIFLKGMFGEETLDDGAMSLPSTEQVRNNIEFMLDATLKDAALEVYYDSIREGGEVGVDEDVPGIPGDMVDENGEFIRDWSGWGLGDTASRSLRDGTWEDVKGEDIPLASESPDIGSHFDEFTEAMEGALRVSG